MHARLLSKELREAPLNMDCFYLWTAASPQSFRCQQHSHRSPSRPPPFVPRQPARCKLVSTLQYFFVIWVVKYKLSCWATILQVCQIIIKMTDEYSIEQSAISKATQTSWTSQLSIFRRIGWNVHCHLSHLCIDRVPRRSACEGTNLKRWQKVITYQAHSKYRNILKKW